ncbi:MAG: flagellar brake protein [Hydrogenophilus sp.]|nr:flagellar brake protein [Hydrogenophilus sp.]
MQPNRPVPQTLRILEFDRYPDHIIAHPREIETLLKALIAQRTQLGLFVGGQHLFTTQLIELDPHFLWLDISRNPALNQRALGQPAICLGRLDGVHTQFALKTLTLDPRAGGEAFRSERPTAILRLQRREYYRLKVPLSHNVVCRINISPPGTPPVYIPLRVLDLSAGGIALLAPPSSVRLTEGQRYSDCFLYLPHHEPIKVTLEVRNLFHILNRTGHYVERAGCCFVDLPLAAQKILQRYILNTQREVQRAADNRS